MFVDWRQRVRSRRSLLSPTPALKSTVPTKGSVSVNMVLFHARIRVARPTRCRSLPPPLCDASYQASLQQQFFNGALCHLRRVAIRTDYVRVDIGTG